MTDAEFVQWVKDHWTEKPNVYERTEAEPIVQGVRGDFYYNTVLDKYTHIYGNAGWIPFETGGGKGVLEPVQDLTALRAIDTTDAEDWPDKWAIMVEDEGQFFRLDRQSSVATVAGKIEAPAAGPGRFIRDQDAQLDSKVDKTTAAVRKLLKGVDLEITVTNANRTSVVALPEGTRAIHVILDEALTGDWVPVDITGWEFGACYSFYIDKLSDNGIDLSAIPRVYFDQGIDPFVNLNDIEVGQMAIIEGRGLKRGVQFAGFIVTDDKYLPPVFSNVFSNVFNK